MEFFEKYLGLVEFPEKGAMNRAPTKGGVMKRFTPNIPAILVLTCGIAFAAAVFAIVDRINLRQLPYDRPEQLMALGGVASSPDGDFLGYWGQAKTLSGIFTYKIQEAALERSEMASVCVATENLFDVLGVQPVLGRGFSRDKAEELVTVLSYETWNARFSRNPDVLGSSIVLSGVPHVVVGVMGPGFRFIGNPGFYVREPVSSSFSYGDLVKEGMAGTNTGFTVVGRLQEGVSPAAANAELKSMLDELSRILSAATGINYGMGIVYVQPWKALLSRSSAQPLKLLMSCTALILIITFLNAYSLILSRVMGKFSDYAIRLCYGASFTNIFSPVFRLAFAVALPGVILGITASFWISQILTLLLSDRLPDYGAQFPDARIIGFAAAAGLLLCALIAVVVSLYIVRQEPQRFLLNGAGNWLATRSGKFLLKVAVIAQIALSTVLLTAGISSWLNARAMENRSLGFQSDDVVSVQLIIPDAEKRTPERIQRINNQLASFSPAGEPGGFTNLLPMLDRIGMMFLDMGTNNFDQAVTVIIGGNYFQTMNISLLAGRLFNDCDPADLPGAIIISRSFAEKFWETPEAAISQIVKIQDGPTATPRMVTGVVDDVTLDNNMSQMTKQQFYLDYRFGHRNAPLGSLPTFIYRGRYTVAMESALREQLRRIDPELEIRRMSGMKEIVAAANRPFRAMSRLAGAEALVAVLIGVIGLYGFLSYMVQSNHRGISIRMAIGATRANIIGMIMRQGGALALPGLGIGLLIAWWTARLLPAFLSNAALTQPLGLLLIAAIALGSVALGALIPAIRASRIEIYPGTK